MNRILSTSSFLAASFAMFVSAATPGHAETNTAGVTAAVNPTASALEPSGKRKLISLGDPVVRNQRIETGPEGLVQILLADGTSFTVGPNSSIVIDSFVYDPEKQTASLAATMTKGALRFIGGKASKTSGDVKIDTPIGTAGIRGAVVDINLNGKTADGQVIPPHVSLVFGKQVELNSRGASQRVFRPGFSIVAGSGGNSVKRTPPLWISSLQQYLAGRPGQTGGARTVPTDQSVRNSPVATSNSQQSPATNTIPVPLARPLAVTAPEQIAATSNRDNTRPEVEDTGGGTGGDTGGDTDEDIWDGLVGVVYQTTNEWDESELTSSFGQMTEQADGSFSGTDGDGATFTLDGITASDTLTTASVTGSSSVLGDLSGSAYTGSGDFIAYLMTSDDDIPFYVVGGTAASMASTFTGTDVLHYVVSKDPASGAVTIGAVNADLAAALDTDDVVASDLLVVAASGSDSVGKAIQASLSISGEGTDQTSAINVTAGTFSLLSGGGYGLEALSSGGYLTSASADVQNEQSTVETIGSSEGDDELFGDDGEYMVIVSNGESWDGTSTTFNTGANVVSRDDTLTETDGTRSFADTTVTGFATGAVTTDGVTELATGTTSLTFDGTTNSFTGGVDVEGIDSGDESWVYMTSSNSQTAYLTDQLIAAVGEVDGSYLVSSEVVPAEIFTEDDGSTTSEICSSCEFMTWGWWGQAAVGESTTSVHLGNWIVGETPENSDIPTTGTATYTGHAVGTVISSGSQYIATGDLTSTMNFGTRTGSVAISNYDDKDFTTSVTFGTGEATFSGTGTTGTVSSSVTGAFASDGTDPVAGVMGSFTAEDGSWSSTGIFAGSR